MACREDVTLTQELTNELSEIKAKLSDCFAALIRQNTTRLKVRKVCRVAADLLKL